MDFNDMQEMARKAESGDGNACYEIAEYFFLQKKHSQAFTWYQKAFQHHCSNPNVCFNLGYAYQYGEGTEKDMFEAFTYYEKAAKQNHPQAILNLSFFYDTGIVVPRDREKADNLCRQANMILMEQQEELYMLRKEKILLQEYYHKAMQEIQCLKDEQLFLKQKTTERDSVLKQRIKELRDEVEFWKNNRS